MDVKIKLSSKRLNSGRCQVHFHVSTMKGNRSWYGYTLAEPKDTLSEVVGRIKSRFRSADDKISLHQKALYHLNEGNLELDNLMIFKVPAPKSLQETGVELKMDGNGLGIKLVVGIKVEIQINGVTDYRGLVQGRKAEKETTEIMIVLKYYRNE